MLFADGALGLVLFGLWLFCIIDVITTPEYAVRNLPKLVWLFIVILLFDVGCIAWLIAGHNWNGTADRPYKGNRASGGREPGGARYGAPAPRRASQATNPDDDEDFLAGLQARAEEQRRRAREAKGDEPTAGAPE